MVQFLIVVIYLLGAAAIGGAIGLFQGMAVGALTGTVLFGLSLQLARQVPGLFHSMLPRSWGQDISPAAVLCVVLYEHLRPQLPRLSWPQSSPC